MNKCETLIKNHSPFLTLRIFFSTRLSLSLWIHKTSHQFLPCFPLSRSHFLSQWSKLMIDPGKIMELSFKDDHWSFPRFSPNVLSTFIPWAKKRIFARHTHNTQQYFWTYPWKIKVHIIFESIANHYSLTDKVNTVKGSNRQLFSQKYC